METFKRPLARAPHSITAPDFPWAHIGGMFPYLESFKAQLMADELVIWLEGLVPCRSCQTLGTYLRSLLSKSMTQLMEIIQQYELNGRTAVPTCQCGMRRKSLGGSAPPPLPPATCRLNKHKSWHSRAVDQEPFARAAYRADYAKVLEKVHELFRRAGQAVGQGEHVVYALGAVPTSTQPTSRADNERHCFRALPA